MKRDLFGVGTIYCLLLCWPALYRLVLPQGLGDLAYYVIAYAVPLIAFPLVLWRSRNVGGQFLLVLGTILVLAISVLLSTSTSVNLSGLLHAIKFYLTPVLLIILGANIVQRLDSARFGSLMLTVVIGHLLFSLLFYFDILPNAVYAGSGEYSENWISVVGGYRAFVGLTLSKFDLAYQTGFILVSAILCGTCFASRRTRYAVILLASVLVIFTYNKTVALVVVVALLMKGYVFLSERSRLAGQAVLIVASLLVAYPIVRFLNGDIVLTDVFSFLSPQTFWSRVMLWQEVMAFDWSNVIRGVGAGTYASQAVTLDNQFLYAYLEMGVVGAILYFVLFAVLVLKIVPGHAYGKSILLLLAAVFMVGDILNAHALMLVIGLYLGQLVRLSPERDSLVSLSEAGAVRSPLPANPLRA